MATVHRLKQGDRLPVKADGSVQNLTGATVRLYASATRAVLTE